jgi:hypothetical protein
MKKLNPNSASTWFEHKKKLAIFNQSPPSGVFGYLTACDTKYAHANNNKIPIKNYAKNNKKYAINQPRRSCQR